MSVKTAIESKADFVGFVYYPKSPRHLSVEHAADLRLLLPKTTGAVVITVEPDDILLEQIISDIRPDFLQLHGGETPERLREIRKKFPRTGIIKSVPIRTADDLHKADQYIKTVDYLLFDAKPTNKNMMHGGNGLTFDWEILSDKKFIVPWFLSGGLTSENVSRAVKISGAKMVDVSSGVERSAGVKDKKLIEEFIKAAKSCH